MAVVARVRQDSPEQGGWLKAPDFADKAPCMPICATCLKYSSGSTAAARFAAGKLL